ncbi:hypothetical protein ABZ734_33670 [Streptomyces sp. NPDC006660]|uniref:hypothetical protein n=1 Tax=Streptomyces sp. NPDC006660 TaxID=3156901 RepID=UPI0033D7F105
MRGPPGCGSLTAYLQAERCLGRIPATRDCAALALSLTGTTHHLLMTTWPTGPDPLARIEQGIQELTA